MLGLLLPGLATTAATVSVSSCPCPRIPMQPRDDYQSPDKEFEKSLHLSIGFAGLAVLLIMQLHIKHGGYTLSQSWRATDIIMWIVMGVVTAIWTIFVFLSAWVFKCNPCSKAGRADSDQCERGLWPCFARLAFAPWFLITALLWRGLSEICYLVVARFNTRLDYYFALIDPTIESADLLLPFWGMKSLRTWVAGTWAQILFHLLITSFIVLTAVGAFKGHLYTLFAMEIAALLVFYHSMPRHYFDTDLPHQSRLDNVRIPTAGQIDQGLVYILPTRSTGFEARYTIRLDAEYDAMDSCQSKISDLDNRDKEVNLKICRSAIRDLICSRIRSVTIRQYEQYDKDHLKFLARVLCDEKWHEGDEDHSDSLIVEYCENGIPQTRYDAQLLPNTSLVGRDVVAAFLHWESLVFEWRNNLSGDMQQKLDELRPGRLTGQTLDDDAQGLNDAAQKIYNILQPGGSWKLPNVDPPSVSVIFGDRKFGSIDSYAASLWKECRLIEESMFGALYLWTSVWYMDMGNNNGIHVTPLVPKRSETNDFTYSTNWRMYWRHPWHTAILSQLVVILPTIVSSLFAFGG